MTRYRIIRGVMAVALLLCAGPAGLNAPLHFV